MTDKRQTQRSGAQAAAKQEWTTPEITTFAAVTVTKGIQALIGDGINNQS